MKIDEYWYCILYSNKPNNFPIKENCKNCSNLKIVIIFEYEK